MIFFVSVFIIIVFLFLLSYKTKSKKNKKILAILALIILCIISGTRYNTGGTDYFVYKRLYDSLSLEPFISSIAKFYTHNSIELGYVIYMSIIKSFGFNYYGFTLINSIVFYTLFYKFIKRYDFNFNFILILFLYKMFFYNTFISLRQPLAILIFLFSLPYLQKKNFVKYYLCCILAFFFHRSAIILFFVPFITSFNISKNKFIVFLIACLLLFFVNMNNFLNINSLLNNVFSFDSGAIDRISMYSNSSEHMSIFYLLEAYLIAILIILRYDFIYNYDNNSSFFIKLFICIIPFFTIFANIGIVTRFKDYFFIVYPIIVSYIGKSQKKIISFIYIFTICICFYGYVRFIINFDGGVFLNYESFLFKGISIFN